MLFHTFSLQSWKEQIQKAKDLYEEAKVASMDRFYLSYCDEEEELSAPSAAHSGLRRGSYRGSKLSSIGHSYSGSVDMNEFLTIGGNSSPQLAVQHRDQSGTHQGVRRNRSFELQVSVLFNIGESDKRLHASMKARTSLKLMEKHPATKVFSLAFFAPLSRNITLESFNQQTRIHPHRRAINTPSRLAWITELPV